MQEASVSSIYFSTWTWFNMVPNPHNLKFTKGLEADRRSDPVKGSPPLEGFKALKLRYMVMLCMHRWSLA